MTPTFHSLCTHFLVGGSVCIQILVQDPNALSCKWLCYSLCISNPLAVDLLAAKQSCTVALFVGTFSGILFCILPCIGESFEVARQLLRRQLECCVASWRSFRNLPNSSDTPQCKICRRQLAIVVRGMLGRFFTCIAALYSVGGRGHSLRDWMVWR